MTSRNSWFKVPFPKFPSPPVEPSAARDWTRKRKRPQRLAKQLSSSQRSCVAVRRAHVTTDTTTTTTTASAVAAVGSTQSVTGPFKKCMTGFLRLITVCEKKKPRRDTGLTSKVSQPFPLQTSLAFTPAFLGTIFKLRFHFGGVEGYALNP